MPIVPLQVLRVPPLVLVSVPLAVVPPVPTAPPVVVRLLDISPAVVLRVSLIVVRVPPPLATVRVPPDMLVSTVVLVSLRVLPPVLTCVLALVSPPLIMVIRRVVLPPVVVRTRLVSPLRLLRASIGVIPMSVFVSYVDPPFERLMSSSVNYYASPSLSLAIR